MLVESALHTPQQEQGLLTPFHRRGSSEKLSPEKGVGLQPPYFPPHRCCHWQHCYLSSPHSNLPLTQSVVDLIFQTKNWSTLSDNDICTLEVPGEGKFEIVVILGNGGGSSVLCISPWYNYSLYQL